MHVCTQIVLSSNQLCGLDYKGNGTYDSVGIEAIADALRVSASLMSLDLGYNELADEGAKSLAEALRVNVSLTSANLSFNQIGPNSEHLLRDAVAAKVGVDLRL